MSKDLDRLVLGCANLDNQYQNIISITAAEEFIDFALTSGIAKFDTSSQYGGSEPLLASRLKRLYDNRIQVISKYVQVDWKNQIDTSLERFNGKIATLLWHDFERTPARKAHYYKIAEYLRNRKINSGMSVYGINDARQAFELFPDVVQIDCNLLTWRTMIDAVAEARSRGIKIMIRSVFARGYLTSKVMLNRNLTMCPLREEIKKLYDLAIFHGISLEEMAFRFIKDITDLEQIVVGVSYKHEIKEIVSWSKKPFMHDSIHDRIRELTMDVNYEKADLRKWT